jgi:outer membrane protein TolC
VELTRVKAGDGGGAYRRTMKTSNELRRAASWRDVAAALAIVGATSLGAWADGPPPTPSAETLTLADAVAEALAHAPALEVAAQHEQAARSKATAARRSRWGEIDAVAGYSRYQDDQIVRPISRQLLAGGFAGLPFDRDQWRYGLTLQVPLYMGGRISASVAAASLEADQAKALLDGSRWQTRFNVTSLYAAAQTLDAVTQAIDGNLAALDETRRKVELAVRIGKRPELDLLKLADEIADAQARRADTAADGARVRALLLALLGRDPAAPLRLEPLSQRRAALETGRDELRTLALAASPVERARLAAEQAGQAVRIAHSAFLPSVAGRASYLRNDAPSVSPLDTWEISVGVSYPVFTGRARGAELAAARHGEQAAASALAKVRLDQEAQLAEALARWDAAGAALDASAARVAASREAARIEQIRYDTGAGAIDDLLRARARELAAEAALAQARGDAVVAAARVDTVCEKEVLQ